MGLNASSDEWCSHSDDTIILAPTLDELKERAHIVLQRCRELNITISLKKLEMGQEISFADHTVSQSGISKYRAIAGRLRMSSYSSQPRPMYSHSIPTSIVSS